MTNDKKTSEALMFLLTSVSKNEGNKLYSNRPLLGCSAAGLASMKTKGVHTRTPNKFATKAAEHIKENDTQTKK